MITSLKTNEIFVAGTNLSGRHSGGAAYQAKKDFGLCEFVGEGLSGRSYAFPTLDRELKKLPIEWLIQSRDIFYRCAESHPQFIFLMTAVGTGIAGYDEESMKSLFKDPPKNVILPGEWL